MLIGNLNVEVFDVLAPCGATVMGGIIGDISRGERMADLPLSSYFCE